MSAKRRIEAAIFDMDGLLIDSEPLWDQAEVEVMESLGVDTRRRDELPDLLGLRIDLVVDLWYAQQPWRGVDRAEATARIIRPRNICPGANRTRRYTSTAPLPWESTRSAASRWRIRSTA